MSRVLHESIISSNKYNCVRLAILSSSTRVHPTKDKNFIVSGTSIKFPSRLNLSAMESVLSLDPDAWHRLLLGLLGITSNILVSTSITPVRAACIGLRVNVALISWQSSPRKNGLHSITPSHLARVIIHVFARVVENTIFFLIFN